MLPLSALVMIGSELISFFESLSLIFKFAKIFKHFYFSETPFIRNRISLRDKAVTSVD